MDLNIILILVILGIAVLFFIFEWIRPDVVAVLVLVTLTVTGIITPEEAFSGFSSNAVIAIAALLVIGAGLVRSGVVRWMSDQLGRIVSDRKGFLLVVTTGSAGLLSGFINIVAAVSIFIPAVLRMAHRCRVSPSKLLLPMAVTSLLGANLTLIGASHNLVVDSLLRETTQESFGFFEFTAVGAVLLVVSVLYSLFFGRFLLPDNHKNDNEADLPSRDDVIDTYALNERLWEILIRPKSDVVGKPLKEIGMGKQHGLSPIMVIRKKEALPVENEEFQLQEKDVVAVGGCEERIEDFMENHEGLVFMGQADGHEEFSWSMFELVEIVVPPRSAVIDHTLRDLDFREDTGLTCIALWRDNRPFRTDARDRNLKGGDALLLFGAKERVRNFKPEPDFLWLRKPPEEEAPLELRHLGPIAAAIFAAVIISAALGWVSIAVAALAGAALIILTGILGPKLAYKEVNWRTVVLIGGMYPVGVALEKTGAAGRMADLLVAWGGGYGPVYALLAVAFLTVCLTQPMHNAVAALIMTPVALDVAKAMDSNPKAFALAVIIGASASFLMPVGHPAPLLVQKPGRYRNRDYFYFGIGLGAILLGVVAGIIPLLWPL